MPVRQWTRSPGKNQHLYFTSPSVTADDRWLVILSDRDGHPNVYAIDRRDGRIHRVSRNESGLRRSYVYPRGGAVGLSKASPCLDARLNRVFYVRGDQVFRVDLNDREAGEKRLADLPPGWVGGFTHVSPDGKIFAIPCVHPLAFGDEATQWEQLARVPRRMQDGGWETRIYFVDTTTGESRIAASVPFWVTHLQFDPAGSGRLIFNREGQEKGVPLPDRIWCRETNGTIRPLAEEEPGEWRSHENWSPDGRSIVYHGSREGRAFVAARTWAGDLLHETAIEGVEFWHATAHPDGRRLAVDRRDGWISLLDPAADSSERLVDLCRHDTSYEDQDAHAHPMVNPNGIGLIFTTNRTGDCQVHEIMLPATGSEPRPPQRLSASLYEAY